METDASPYKTESLAAISEWIERNESLLASHLLMRRADAKAPPALCAAFLSRSGDGSYQLRLCEGADDQSLNFHRQRRVQRELGRAFAEARLNIWLTRRERQGYEATWSASVRDQPAPNFARA